MEVLSYIRKRPGEIIRYLKDAQQTDHFKAFYRQASLEGWRFIALLSLALLSLWLAKAGAPRGIVYAIALIGFSFEADARVELHHTLTPNEFCQINFDFTIQEFVVFSVAVCCASWYTGMAIGYGIIFAIEFIK